MKLTEKLDLLLKEFYLNDKQNEDYSLQKAIQDTKIKLSPLANGKSLARRLKSEGLVDLKDMKSDMKVTITDKGRIFCEQTSFAYPGFPIITYF
ncbi:MAG: hypothetical protein DI539_13915 [Flavobacterium psychrophilum]|nr:MAG: hypothetical protein DI539_13915 [Flavobacterium psychrophilum]